MWVTRAHALLLCVSVCVSVSVSVTAARRFDTRCKLVRELLRVGVPSDVFLGQWVCLIEKVSNRDTKAFNVTPSGKKYFGLYQIPSRWCRERKAGGECNIKCEAFLDDDIRAATACAQLIFQKEGFKYWSAWSTRCKNDNMITSEIYKCPDLMSPRASPERSFSRSSTRSESFRDRRRLVRSGRFRRVITEPY